MQHLECEAWRDLQRIAFLLLEAAPHGSALELAKYDHCSAELPDQRHCMAC